MLNEELAVDTKVFCCFLRVTYVFFTVHEKLDNLLNDGHMKNVSRWYKFLANQNGFKGFLTNPQSSSKNSQVRINLESSHLGLF